MTKSPVPLRLYWFTISTFALLVLGVALYRKGDVKAALKMVGIEISIEAKESAAPKP